MCRGQSRLGPLEDELQERTGYDRRMGICLRSRLKPHMGAHTRFGVIVYCRLSNQIQDLPVKKLRIISVLRARALSSHGFESK